MDRSTLGVVLSLVLTVLGLVLFVVPVLPKGSPWQSGNPNTNGTSTPDIPGLPTPPLPTKSWVVLSLIGFLGRFGLR